MLRRGGVPFDRAAAAGGDVRRDVARRDRPAERRSAGGRFHRPVAAAETYLGTTGDRSDRSEEGCRRFSSGQYRADDLRTAVLSAGHAGRDSRIAKILRDRNRRTALRRDRPQQHRRPSDRQPAVAERLGLYGDAVPQPDEGS